MFSKIFQKSADFVQYSSKIGKYTFISSKIEILSYCSAEVGKNIDYKL